MERDASVKRMEANEPVEFPLPVRADVLPHSVSPWIRHVSILPREQAREELARRWNKPLSPTLAALREKLLTGTPASIAVWNGIGWLKLVVPLEDWKKTKSAEFLGSAEVYNDILVPEPIEEDIARQSLERLGYGQVQDLVTFFSMFNGLREAAPPNAAEFADVRCLRMFSDWEPQPDDEFDPRHQNDLIIYDSPGGDVVVVDKKGRTNWWNAEERSFEPIAQSFPAFIALFADFVGFGNGFNSYSFAYFWKNRFYS